MNIETILGIAGAFGGLEALKWLANLRTSRKKAKAEAEESLETVIAKRVKTYEESITFLQSQLREKEQQFAELSAKYHESMQHGIELTRRLGEMKLKYRSSRCERKECEKRRPPFRWMKAAASTVAAVCILILPSCTKTIYLPSETVIERHDTLRSVRTVRDTVYCRDSVFLLQKGDTVIKESWHWRSRKENRVDTVYVSTSGSERHSETKTLPFPRESFWSRYKYLLISLPLILLSIYLLRHRK